MADTRWLCPAVLIMLTAMSTGCLQDLEDPSASFSAIPHILMDHYDEDDVSKIYIMSVLSHVRYESINLRIVETEGGSGNSETLTEEFTYSLAHVTNATAFDLSIIVTTEDREFYLDCSVLKVDGPDVFYQINIDPPKDTSFEKPEEIELDKGDLPWKKTLRERPVADE
jgi:hypothetical protein